jgi:hypothetical protein
MLHAPVVGCAVPKNTTVTTTRDPLTPSSYVALRRKASRMDLTQAAALIAVKADDQARVRALIRQLETPGVVALDIASVALLRKAFRIDPSIYRQLATEPADRHPQICRGCGCSDWDACEIWPDDRCGWAAPNLCTCCGGND